MSYKIECRIFVAVGLALRITKLSSGFLNLLNCQQSLETEFLLLSDENSSMSPDRAFRPYVRFPDSITSHLGIVLFCFMREIMAASVNSPGNLNDDFPKSLQAFGYGFNDGLLRKVDSQTELFTDSPYVFSIKSDDPEYNQRHYEALGEAITDYIYELLQLKLKLKKIPVPAQSCPSTFIFVSEDYLTNDKLLIIIHGNGVVRAGQWARRLIINDGLESGTQFYYIERAINEGYAVIVTNTNDNERIIKGKRTKIEGSENPVKHLTYVWEHFVENSAAQHVAVVAHSYGGVCILELAKRIPSVRSKVFAIALTDSVHSMEAQSIPARVRDFLQTVAQNWCGSREPLDTPLKTASFEVKRVSAGHTQHEMTSHACRESVFTFLNRRLTVTTQAKASDKKPKFCKS